MELVSFGLLKDLLFPLRQPTEGEKIFANEATDKGFISQIYKHLLPLNTKKKKKTPSKNGQKI